LQNGTTITTREPAVATGLIDLNLLHPLVGGRAHPGRITSFPECRSGTKSLSIGIQSLQVGMCSIASGGVHIIVVQPR